MQNFGPQPGSIRGESPGEPKNKSKWDKVKDFSPVVTAAVLVLGLLGTVVAIAVPWLLQGELDAIKVSVDRVEKSVNERIRGLDSSVRGQIDSVEDDLDGRLDDLAERLSRVEGLLSSIRDALSSRTISAELKENPESISQDDRLNSN